MEGNRKIIVEGVDTANCNFEPSEVTEDSIELLNPEDYAAEQSPMIAEVNKKLREANEQIHMAQMREEMFTKGFNAGMYIAVFDENEHMVSFEFTDGTRRMLGYDGTDDLPNEFDSWVKTLIPEQKDKIVKLFWDAVKMHRHLPEISHAEYQMRKKDGSIIWVTGAGRFVRRGDGSLKVYMGCYREVTAEHDKEEYLRSLGEYRRVMSSTGFGMWHLYLKDGTAPRMRVNDKMAELLGLSEQNLTDEEFYSKWHERIVPEAAASVQACIDRILSGHPAEITYQWIHPKKGMIYVRGGGTAEKLQDGTSVLSGYHGDVTHIILEEQRRREEIESLNKRILIDPLTGANNRNAVDQYLDKYLTCAQKATQLAMIDVDHFKTINDVYGHQAGDRALQLLARSFMTNLTEKTFFARYGGDEFLLVSRADDPEEIRRIVEKAGISLKDNCRQESIGYSIDFSCGIVQMTSEMKNGVELLKAADAEMYRIKEAKHVTR